MSGSVCVRVQWPQARPLCGSGRRGLLAAQLLAFLTSLSPSPSLPLSLSLFKLQVSDVDYLEKSDLAKAGIDKEVIEVIMSAIAHKKLKDLRTGPRGGVML
jgi:hypothetical protein